MNIRLLFAFASRDGDYYNVKGALILKNLCYHKNVIFHHDTKGYWEDIPCSYVNTLDNEMELWEFNIPIHAPVGPYVGSKKTQFSLKYEALQPYQIFWDNNEVRDYIIGVKGRSAGWEFPDIAIGNPILLANATIQVNKFKGRLAVRNIVFEKRITIRYTTDNWSSYNDLSTNYAYSYNPNDDQVYEGEIWEFETNIPIGLEQINFAIRYEFADQVFWDNNLARNYLVNNNETIGIRSANTYF